MKNNRNSINIQNWFKQVENHLLCRQRLLIPPSHHLWHLCTAWHHCTPGAGCRRCWSQFLTQTPCRLKHNTLNCIPKKFPGKIIKARKAANWRKLITEKFLIKLGKSRSVCKEKKKRNKRQQTCLQVTKGRVNGIREKRWGMTAGNGKWCVLQQLTIMGLKFISQINNFGEAKGKCTS